MEESSVVHDQLEGKSGDDKLWFALKQGDQRALKKLYEANINGLLQYGLRFTRDRSTVEDCIHDLFVHIWKNRARLGETDSPTRYLLVSLRRSLVKQINKSRKTADLPDQTEDRLGFEASAESRMISFEATTKKKADLSRAMQQLSARQQEAIFLKYSKELGYEEVAEIMNINYQSVRNLVHTGIIRLRKLVGIGICMLISSQVIILIMCIIEYKGVS